MARRMVSMQPLSKGQRSLMRTRLVDKLVLHKLPRNIANAQRGTVSKLSPSAVSSSGGPSIVSIMAGTGTEGFPDRGIFRRA